MFLIIGNVIALVASLLMVYSGILKEKKKILYVQTVQIGLSVASNIVLGGITGAIINAISMIRNIICYKEKLGTKEKIIITILSVSLSLIFNNLGLIGILPVVSTVTYVWLMNIKDVKKFKEVNPSQRRQTFIRLLPIRTFCIITRPLYHPNRYKIDN